MTSCWQPHASDQQLAWSRRKVVNI